MSFLIKIKHLAPPNHKGKRFKASSLYSDATMTRSYQYEDSHAEIIALAFDYFASIRPAYDLDAARTPENFTAELLGYDDAADVVVMRKR
jgi:hypothetical protein